METANLAALFDIHFPLSIPALWDAKKSSKQTTPILNFLSDFGPDVVVLGGDQMDFDCISFFTRGKVRLLEGRRLSQDYKGFNLFLDRLDAVVDKKAKKKIALTGNHEWRTNALIESDPQSYEGLIEWEDCLHMRERGWKIVDYGMTYSCGKMTFHHGNWKQGYMPILHAKAAVQIFRRNIFYGHLHTVQSFTDTSPVDAHSLIGQSVGTLGTVNPEWMLNRPSAWQNSFLTASIRPDGNFNHYVTNVINDQFSLNGEHYALK